jgi:hypothetical protein
LTVEGEALVMLAEAAAEISGPAGAKLPEEHFVDKDDEVPQQKWLTPDQRTDDEWTGFKLWERVKETLYALPASFRMEGNLPEIPASDLHAANTLLGAAIEDHIPVALNQLRRLWDPNSEYPDCLFKRQPQTFPDVPFRRETARGAETIFGIEIKSWYILAKELEPSFRFNVNRNFCHPADLAVVYPWALSAGVSGTPRLFRPLVLSARKAARLREASWLAKAADPDWQKIDKPTGPFSFHPAKEDRINDSSPRDKGNNMGRIARSGVWDVEIQRLLNEERISGIPLAAWQAFLSSFKESTTLEKALQSIRKIAAHYAAGPREEIADTLKQIADGLVNLGEKLDAKVPQTPRPRARQRRTSRPTKAPSDP